LHLENVLFRSDAATSEIGEVLGISRQGADRRLRSLRDAGDVASKKIGASLVWFTPRDRRRRVTPPEARRSRLFLLFATLSTGPYPREVVILTG
jgi:predicted ArsR family transcriptional regulator